MTVWCVEDDNDIREIEIYTLLQTGFKAEGFADSASFFEALKRQTPDLVLLDIMLPGADGIEILKEIRKSPSTAALPVIMATAKGSEYDKIKSLDLGADDYLVKPFGMMEMVSRIKAVLRRCTPTKACEDISFESIDMNEKSRTVRVNSNPVELTFKEFEILKLFLQNPDTVFTRERLFSEVWGEDYIGETRTVDMHIRTLRKKLGKEGDCISTVRNVGYKLEAHKG